MPGFKCPLCKSATLFDQDSQQDCSTCGFLGWRVNTLVAPGKGKGFRCPNCKKQTLHVVSSADSPVQALRCSICLYSGARQNPIVGAV